MGYLLMVLKVSYRRIIFAWYIYTIFRKGVPEKMQVGRISAVEYFENSLI